MNVREIDMGDAIVAKFGGSSLANSHQFKKVKDIIESDDNRRYIVPSAPGKSNPDDTKVTDLLYVLENLCRHELDMESVLNRIKDKFNEIINGCNIDLDLDPYLDKIIADIRDGATKQYVASRGEYINGIILSKYLGFPFIDAKELIFFDSDGNLDEEMTYRLMSKKLAKYEKAVIPGFYGSMPNGRINTFSRGGSDLTGSLVARATNASKYENWTDVSGFLVCDPKIVDNPRGIETISYKELRELSYMGASVLHDEAIFPVVSLGIPIIIKNTNSPKDPGTRIISDTQTNQNLKNITGIAGRKNFFIINIEKVKLNSSKDFHRKLMSILESHDIYLEHMPSSIDSISLIIDKSHENKIEEIIEDINIICKPDSIDFINHISLITVVGKGMRNTTGTSARIFTALANAHVNIRTIVQGSSELNIIIGVEDNDYENAIRAIYDAFII